MTKKQSYVLIKIGNRYFYRLGKNKRILTAWSIDGAKCFVPNCEALKEVIDYLSFKRKKFDLITPNSNEH